MCSHCEPDAVKVINNQGIEYCNDDDVRKRQECKTWVEDVQRRKDDRVADNRNPWIAVASA